MTPKFLAYSVILGFERSYPKQNSVTRLKPNILSLPKILGWLRHWKRQQSKMMAKIFVNPDVCLS